MSLINKRFNQFVLFLVLLCLLFSTTLLAKEVNQETKHVLYINSYHEGYKWGDDIKSAIEAVFSSAQISINMETFYMDTQL